MTPSHTARNKVRRNRYYVCGGAQKRGWDTCPSKSVPADQIEQVVIQQLRRVGQDPSLLGEVLAQARRQDEERGAALGEEQRGLEKDLAGWHAEVRKLSATIRPGDVGEPSVARLADLQERIGAAEGRLRTVREQAQAVRQQQLDEDQALTALGAFDPVWEALTPLEQARVIRLLVRQVDYDGAKGKVSITFHPTGIQTLADERAAGHDEEVRA